MYVDGSGSPRGGFGWLVKETGESHYERRDDVTNNQAEYMAIISAVRHARSKSGANRPYDGAVVSIQRLPEHSKTAQPRVRHKQRGAPGACHAVLVGDCRSLAAAGRPCSGSAARRIPQARCLAAEAAYVRRLHAAPRPCAPRCRRITAWGLVRPAWTKNRFIVLPSFAGQ